MNIAGCIPFSVIEYPGEISYVVFCQGCNLNCIYCFNANLIEIKKGRLSSEEVLNDIRSRTKITAVVITGGEPTIQKDLIDFIKKVKQIGLKVKIETNGTRPGVLKKLIRYKLLDLIQCDVKATYEGWETVTRSEKSKYFLNEFSVKLIRHSKVPYILRHVEFSSRVSSELKSKYPELEIVKRRFV